MGATSIEWTDCSINPIRARRKDHTATGHYCEKVSAGCAKCYSSTFQPRFHMPTFPGRSKLPPLALMGDSGAVSVNDKVEVFFDDSRLLEVLGRRRSTKFFWCDMTDLFGEWVPDQWIDRCFAVMALTPQHTHQILTKRPERMAEYLGLTAVEQERRDEVVFGVAFEMGEEHKCVPDWSVWSVRYGRGGSSLEWPLPGVWLGTSTEDQARADERIIHLLHCPAAVRFLSVEPLLGPVQLWNLKASVDAQGNIYDRGDEPLPGCGPMRDSGIDWVIAGAESGPGARPMDENWVRSLRDQCVAAGVPFFYKQNAVKGKKIGTPELDGVRWTQMPEPTP